MISRRNALKGMSSLGAMLLLKKPFEEFVLNWAKGFIAETQAAELRSEMPRNLLQLFMKGGMESSSVLPVWHGPTAPSSSSGFHDSLFYANSFQNNGVNVTWPCYKTVPYNYNHPHYTGSSSRVWLPELWSKQIPLSNGGSAPATSLLNNAFLARLNVRDAAHETASLNFFRPGPPYSPYQTIIGNKSSRPLPGIETRGSTGESFRPSDVLAPFVQSSDGLSTQYLDKRALMASAMNQALSILGNYTATRQPGADVLNLHRTRATQLLNRALDLAADENTWTTYADRYRSLVSAAVRTPIPGITDLPVLASTFLDPSVPGYGLFTPDVGTPQIRSPFCYIHNIYTPNIAPPDQPMDDLRKMLWGPQNNAQWFDLPGLAEACATFQWSVENQITSYLSFNQKQFTTYVGSTYLYYTDFDWHSGNVVTTIMREAVTHLALFSVVAEMRSALSGIVRDGATLWEETAIHVGSEFSRHGRIGKLGGAVNSDHNPEGSMHLVFSGALTQGPFVVGNIYQGDSSYYPGDTTMPADPRNLRYPTQRATASPTVLQDGTEPVGNEHFASTLSNLLRIDPETRQKALITLNDPLNAGSGVTVQCEKPKEDSGTGFP